MEVDCVAVGRDTLLSCVVMIVVQVILRPFLITSMSLLALSLLGLVLIGINVWYLRELVRPLLGRPGLNPLRI